MKILHSKALILIQEKELVLASWSRPGLLTLQPLSPPTSAGPSYIVLGNDTEKKLSEAGQCS